MNVFGDYFSDVNKFFNGKELDHIQNCYLCGEKYPYTFNRLYDYLYQCGNCKFVWLANRPKQKDLDDFYAQSAAMSKWAKIKAGPIDTGRQTAKYQWFYDRMNYRMKESVLDVGCGNGNFLDGLPDYMDGMGVEPNADASKHCNSPVVDSISKLTGKYDVITYMGVLEHLLDPKKVVELYSEHLAPDGLIGVIVPNIESLAFKHLKGKNCTICPQHVYYYSIETLNMMMADLGFGLLEHTTLEPELQPIIKMEKFGEPYIDTGWTYHHDTYTEHGILEKNQGAKILALYGRVNHE